MLASKALPRTRLIARQMSSAVHASASTLEVLQRKHLAGRIFTFNRPAALNALNLDMVRTMTPQLRAWEQSDLCSVIILKSDHPKAFCAGGDVKSLVDAISSGNADAAVQFMREEYSLNHLIATTPKPFVALCDGITMGGGVGLSVHAPFRVATEKTIFAMPETAIGLFPDVGGTFFLPRLDGELGTYLALTGDRLTGSDVVSARIATHFVPSERMAALTERLCEIEVGDWGVVNAAIEEFAEPIDPTSSKMDPHRKVIDSCFKHSTMDGIMAALKSEGSPFALTTLAKLQELSPLSMAVTLQQMRAGKTKTISEAFQYEWVLANNVLRQPDFVEGVTAKLFTKPPRTPVWASKSMSAAELQAQSKPRDGLEPLQLLRESTYMQYPHRFLALPSETDVHDVVKDVYGDNGGYAFTSRKEAEDWFVAHWPMRRIVAEGADTLKKLHRTVLRDAEPIHAEELELSVSAGKIGVREHVRAILDRCTDIHGEALKWTWH